MTWIIFSIFNFFLIQLAESRNLIYDKNFHQNRIYFCIALSSRKHYLLILKIKTSIYFRDVKK
jgi:hypothetical protein